MDAPKITVPIRAGAEITVLAQSATNPKEQIKVALLNTGDGQLQVTFDAGGEPRVQHIPSLSSGEARYTPE